MAHGSVRKFNNYSAFRSHRSGGSGGGFLKGWKSNENNGISGRIRIWLHAHQAPTAAWMHNLPYIRVMEDKKDRSKKAVAHVYSQNYVCHEEESVLEQQYFRHDDASRKNPPKRCGICKLLEWCYQQANLFEEILDEKDDLKAQLDASTLSKADFGTAMKEIKARPEQGINFVTPLFKFEGDVADETRVIYLGGICNLFKTDKFTDRQTKAVSDAGIVIGGKTGAWRDKALAQQHFLMTVVNHDRPEDGVQITNEKGSLGDKTKKALEDAVKQMDREYDVDPFCIEWSFNSKEKDMNKMYDAVSMFTLKPGDRILPLITGEAPDLTPHLEKFNQQSVRATLEKHCLLEDGVVPWDDLFPTAEQSKAWAAEDEERAAAEGEGGDDEDPFAAPRAGGTPAADEDDEEVACDDCKKPMKASASVCPHCGKKYDVGDGDDDDGDKQDSEPPPPQPPPAKGLRTRAEIAAEKAKAAAADDDIPFPEKGKKSKK